MKRFVAFALVLTLGLFTLGCGGGGGEKKPAAKPSAGATPAAPSTPAPGGEKK